MGNTMILGGLKPCYRRRDKPPPPPPQSPFLKRSQGMRRTWEDMLWIAVRRVPALDLQALALIQKKRIRRGPGTSRVIRRKAANHPHDQRGKGADHAAAPDMTDPSPETGPAGTERPEILVVTRADQPAERDHVAL